MMMIWMGLAMKMMEKTVSSAEAEANDRHFNRLQVEEVVHHSIHCSYEWELLPLEEEKDIQVCPWDGILFLVVVVRPLWLLILIIMLP